jgi:transcriptional regulator with XRE-family HTH domain
MAIKIKNRKPKSGDDVDVRVGQRIRAYRISKRMSQSDLGEKIGVTFQQVQKYERGTNRLGSSRLKKVATALEVPIASLFGESDIAESGTTDQLITEILTQPYATRLLRAFNSIPNVNLQLALLHMAESIAQDTR